MLSTYDTLTVSGAVLVGSVSSGEPAACWRAEEEGGRSGTAPSGQTSGNGEGGMRGRSPVSRHFAMKLCPFFL